MQKLKINGYSSARDLLASEPFTKAVICVVPELVSSLRFNTCRLADCFPFQKIVS